MPEVGKGYIEVEADKAHFDRSLRDLEDDSGGRLSGIGKGIGKAISIGIGGAIAGAVAAGVIGKELVGAASDLNENLSKVGTVFGDWSIDIEQFAKSAANSVGLSQNAALEAAGTFGNLFDQLGFGHGTMTDLSTDLITLASDLGSFHNADITDVIEAQTAAFRGEYDSLQRYIPTINAAAVEQKALEQTGKKTTKELTAQDKALATHTLMMEGAGAAVGDFARTSDGAANKQRILAARFENLKVTLGQALLPVFNVLLDVFDDVISGMTAFIAAFKDGGDDITSSGLPGFFELLGVHARNVFDWLKVNVPPVLDVIGQIIQNQIVPALQWFANLLIDDIYPALRSVIEFLIEHEEILIGVGVVIGGALVAAFTSWAISAGLAAAATLAAIAPVIAIGAAIAALVAGIIYAYREWDWFRATVDAVARFITDTLVPAFVAIYEFIRDHVIPIIAAVVGKWIEFHAAVIEKVIVALQALWGFINDKVLPILSTLWSWIDDIAEIFTEAFDTARQVVEDAAKKIIEWLDKIIGPMEKALGLATDLAKKVGLVGEGTVLKDWVEQNPEGRASGGPVTAGKPYWVGENGRPELFVPEQSGTIVPDYMLGGGGNTYILNTETQQSDADVADQFARMELLAGWAA